jgi:hypothetical protein
MPTDIKLKNSVTATNAPTSLQQGEVAINITDKKMWVGNAATTPVQIVGTGSGGGGAAGSNTQVQFNSSGALAGSANLTFNGTTLTAGGLTTTGATSTGTFSASGVATFSAGTVSAPAITTTGDTNTGIFFPAADTIAFTEGGVESMRINSSGNVGIGTDSPAQKLEVSGGAAQFNGGGIDGTFGDAILFGNTSLPAIQKNRIRSSISASPTSNLLSFEASTGTVGAYNANQLVLNGAGNVGIGVSSISSGGTRTVLQISNGSSGGVVLLGNAATDTDNARIVGNSLGGGVQDLGLSGGGATGVIASYTNGSERMRIDSSGNVGIGTSSPAVKLDVRSATSVIAAVSTTGTNSAYMYVSNTGGDFYLGRNNSAGTTFGGDGYAAVLYSAGAYPMQFYTNGTERMRIDASGRVGIGCTPANNVAAGYSFLDIGSTGTGILSNGTTVYLSQNAYFNGGFKYGINSQASQMTLDAGVFNVLSAGTGTADAAVTLTQTLSCSKDNSLALQGATIKSGTGITFPATQSASSDANTLDDYEEGTWTPTIGRDGSVSPTYAEQVGYYVKIGRVVYVWGYVVWSAIGTTGAGANNINGLPFNAGLSQQNGWANFGGSTGLATNPVLAGMIYNTNVYLRKSANILAGTNADEAYQTSGVFAFNGMYNVF